LASTDASTPGRAADDPVTPATLGAAAQVFVADLEALTVAPEDEHHLVQVLRLRPGESVVASDGAGRWRRCRFVAPARGSGGSDGSGGSGGSPIVEADGPVVCSPRAEPEVTVAFVPVKGDRPEWVVQKLTEAGVDRIVVCASRRAVVRWEGERGARAVARLRRVAREAAAQSRRTWLPEVLGVAGLDDLAVQLAPVPLALAQFGGDPPSIGAPALAVGPEGGWDPAEAAGHRLVGLGPQVLRAETAAVAAGLLLCSLRGGLVRSAEGPEGPSTPGPVGP
jgi:16S rRNA (uracil1498-N3)-methyltransferase